MPLVPVDEKGTVLYYEDSGAPANRNNVYTTVIIVHGTNWNGGVFRKVLPLGSEHNLRVITVNQRDYTASTPPSASELAQLTSQSPRERLQYLKDRAKEIAKFVLWIITNENLPPPDANHSGGGRAEGGVSLVAWSSGNHLLLPFLALGGDFLSPQEQSLMGKYLRSYVMFDSPPDTSGISPPILGDPNTTPANNYTVLEDPEVAKAYGALASSYFTHSPTVLGALQTISTSSHPFDNPVSVTDADILKGLAVVPDTSLPPSITGMPEGMAEPVESLTRSQIPVVLIGEGIYTYTRQRALFGDANTAGLDIGEDVGGNGLWLPHVKMEIVSCGRGSAICVWNVWKLYGLIRDRVVGSASQGSANSGGGQSTGTATSSAIVRPVHFHLWKDFNHFPHWDHPQEFIKSLVEIV
ncbi:hypothetical protein K474DRAFT_1711475 [Panus rudis PR-1116 ss-1]|nr:hypothetical protein K474DRAFT_1711475 [Panus rudis PR-1116 ss-1]